MTYFSVIQHQRVTLLEVVMTIQVIAAFTTNGKLFHPSTHQSGIVRGGHIQSVASLFKMDTWSILWCNINLK